MKTLNTFMLALGALATLVAAGLQAQSRAVAKIPFDFTVQAVTLPAGEYTLAPLSDAGVIQIRNNETGKSVAVLAPPALSNYKGDKTALGKVIFHRYGDHYFFSEVWIPNGLRGGVAPDKVERELRANGTENHMASVEIPLGDAQ
jgi:hypothetical protein